MLYSYFTQKCIFMYILEAKNPCFVTKNCSKSSCICVFISSKKPHNWFYKNLHNSRMVGGRKLPYPSLNHIFNALSIGVQYTLSFQWSNFGLKCLLQWKHFENDEKSFLFHLKSSYRSQDIWFFVLTCRSCGWNGLVRNIIYVVTTWLTNNYNTHTAHHLAK